MNTITITVAAALGAVTSGLLGWCDSAEPFNTRKFMGSVIRAVFAGAGFAIAYTFTDSIGVLDVVIAFLGGSGIDALGNRVSGAIKAGLVK